MDVKAAVPRNSLGMQQPATQNRKNVIQDCFLKNDIITNEKVYMKLQN